MMIDVKNLSFNYRGGFKLDIPRLEISAGEKLALIGPSGSGKTTLLNLIAGMLLPTSGSIFVNSFNVAQLDDHRRREFRIRNIGFVFQDFELIDYLNVQDNILLPYRISNKLKLDTEVRDRAVHLAEQMDMADKLRRSARDLSQGEKQRVAICRALLTGAKLILADEATGNLDPRNKQIILDLLFESVDEHDATLISVTHDHELLSRFDRVIDFAGFCGEAAE